MECVRFNRLGWLLHAFSTRRGGVGRAPAAGLNLGFTESDRRAQVEENRRIFFRQLGAERFALASLRQIHSSRFFLVSRDEAARLEYRPGELPPPPRREETPPAGDGLLSDQPGIVLSVRSADCLPILLVDPKRRAVAALHAGWRGALARIVEKAVGEMHSLFGSEPGRLLAAAGPPIRACCYEVREDVVQAFCGRGAEAEKFFRRLPTGSPQRREHSSAPFLSLHAPGNERRFAAHLDLVAVARDQLRSAGVLSRNTFVAEFCTACRTDLFFSHRKEGRQTGRLMAVIGLRPETRG